MNVNKIAVVSDWARANWLVLGLAAAVLAAGWILSRIARNLRQATAGASKDWVKYLIRFANAIALAFNAEGMYFLLRDDVKTIPIYLAAGGFFIFELFQVINMALAGRKYKAERTPGKYASMVWLIALAAVSVVCMNAGSAAEVGLRVALAVIVVLGWQVTLTADGVTKSRWVFAHWWESKLANAGLKIGKDTNDGGIDYEEIARAAKVRKLVTLSDKVRRSGKLTGWRVDRLNRLLRNVAEEDMDRVVAQVRVAEEGRVRLGLEPPAEVRRTGRPTGSTPTGSTGRPTGAPTASSLLGSSSQDVLVGSTIPTDEEASMPTVHEKVEQDAVLIEALRQEHEKTGSLSIGQARDVITPPGSKTKAGPDRAKRLMKLAGLLPAKSEE